MRYGDASKRPARGARRKSSRSFSRCWSVAWRAGSASGVRCWTTFHPGSRSRRSRTNENERDQMRNVPTDAQLQVMCDKQEIHDVIMRYARAVDRFDAALLESCYHRDGVDHRGDVPKTGAEYTKFVLGPEMNGKYRLTRHQLSNILIDVQGEVARAETYFTAIHRYSKDGREVELTQYGRFLDLFTRRDSVWKISKRWRVRDFARLEPVLDDPQPPAGWYLGQKSTADHVYTVFERDGGAPR
ncbi:MAG: nuclear transport factor 2 family protein [Chloroflexi bacterium]|nr:MAG: nuclear transport factor 2 family protein [Chloroflexota bacterium]